MYPLTLAQSTYQDEGTAMSPQKKNNIPADKLDLYDKLIKTNRKIRRKGAANPYTSVV